MKIVFMEDGADLLWSTPRDCDPQPIPRKDDILLHDFGRWVVTQVVYFWGRHARSTDDLRLAVCDLAEVTVRREVPPPPPLDPADEQEAVRLAALVVANGHAVRAAHSAAANFRVPSWLPGTEQNQRILHRLLELLAHHPIDLQLYPVDPNCTDPR